VVYDPALIDCDELAGKPLQEFAALGIESLSLAFVPGRFTWILEYAGVDVMRADVQYRMNDRGGRCRRRFARDYHFDAHRPSPQNASQSSRPIWS